MGELQSNGKREVFFEANGVPRVVEVADRAAEQATGKKAVREKVDVAVLGSVGAPMAGTIIEVVVKTGMTVTAGQQLVVMSAMKMETAVCAPVGGVITQVGQVDNEDMLDLTCLEHLFLLALRWQWREMTFSMPETSSSTSTLQRHLIPLLPLKATQRTSEESKEAKHKGGDFKSQ
jgi:biotin carboxyl carrier protein